MVSRVMSLICCVAGLPLPSSLGRLKPGDLKLVELTVVRSHRPRNQLAILGMIDRMRRMQRAITVIAA